MIITIDGPAGAGKGTLSKALAKKHNFKYLDTGALFRAVGLCLLKDKKLTDENFEDKAIFYAKNLNFEFNKDFKCILNGKDVSVEIRSAQAGILASKVGAIPAVRPQLDKWQQKFAQNYKAKGAILDGRDCGTAVVPDAELKFFLTCPVEIRAHRRMVQLEELGLDADYDELLDMIATRDKQDQTRKVRPMKPAKDAIIIDTAELPIDQMVKLAEKHLKLK